MNTSSIGLRSRVVRVAFPLALALALLALIALQVRHGETLTFGWGDVAHAVGGAFGFADAPEGTRGIIMELRLWRALSGAGVGACLALAGALLQGLFRNGLAAPSLIGVTSGASLGATIAILVMGGYGPSLLATGTSPSLPYLLTLCAFVGALAVATFVLTFASRGGTLSVPTLLLLGVAINTCIAGLLSATQALLLDDWEVSRAILSWTFGTLDDRRAYHVVLVSCGVAVATLAIPFVAAELDLFAGGEADAHSVGVNTTRTKILVLLTASFVTACAVATAGQIAFVGLVVPHLMRLLTGPHHKNLLWSSMLAGAVFLLGADLAQLAVFTRRELPPGVVMSLIGGPILLVLLVRMRREVRGW
ncbi:MAG: iron ABC transporter permease [Planctomycetes bacterium]|nr:iron ABC transporter permease [Planctomycetota bacterium]